ncbi:MAG: threonine synthase, partial [Planctomycetota bacterium]
MFLIHLDCTECAREHAPVRWQGVCTDCGAPLQARYDLGAVGRAVRPAYLTARPGVMWRYRELLPLRDPEAAVTLGEGGTPLLPLPSLGRELGLERLLLKDEAHNPTGSFKARGMSVAVSMARALGATTLAAPSAGNAGGALAAYGARAGLPVVLALPEDTPAAHRLEAEIHGARVHLVAGTIADCGRWIAERAAKEGWTDLSTLKEPYRIEGKKTLGLELAEQLGWERPDV